MNPDDFSFYDVRSKMGVPRRVLQYRAQAIRRVKDNIIRNFQLGKRNAVKASVMQLLDLSGSTRWSEYISKLYPVETAKEWTREDEAQLVMNMIDNAYVYIGDPIERVQSILSSMQFEQSNLDILFDESVATTQKLLMKTEEQPSVKRSKLDE